MTEKPVNAMISTPSNSLRRGDGTVLPSFETTVQASDLITPYISMAIRYMAEQRRTAHEHNRAARAKGVQDGISKTPFVHGEK